MLLPQFVDLSNEDLQQLVTVCRIAGRSQASGHTRDVYKHRAKGGRTAFNCQGTSSRLRRRSRMSSSLYRFPRHKHGRGRGKRRSDGHPETRPCLCTTHTATSLQITSKQTGVDSTTHENVAMCRDSSPCEGLSTALPQQCAHKHVISFFEHKSCGRRLGSNGGCGPPDGGHKRRPMGSGARGVRGGRRTLYLMGSGVPEQQPKEIPQLPPKNFCGMAHASGATAISQPPTASAFCLGRATFSERTTK